MSANVQNSNSLNRRPSIHSATRPRNSFSNPSRPLSTFEIEVEYISSTQQPSIPNAEINNTNDNSALRSVIEEEEEEDRGAAIGRSSSPGRSLPPLPMRPPARPYPMTLPRSHSSRPMSEIYPRSSSSNPVPEDQFARIYEPSVMNSMRTNSPFQPAQIGANSSGHLSRYSVGGHHVQAAMSQSEFLQSSHVQHDETPVLSSDGSTDEDEDEVHSPVALLDVVEDGTRQGQGDFSQDSHINSQDIQEPPELETQETLRRERTRILERSVVSTYRQIDYKDITNIRPLKKGGYGEIHTAEWSRLRVVLKRALPEHDKGLEILKRVHDYDFIVPFYGVTTDPQTNVRCMVMKYCTNGNLCVFLEKNHNILTWSERYRLAVEITKGLEFLHKAGFHHRDLHSGNILLDDKRTPMICDFGLSRESNKEQTADIAETIGVASFLAPERFPQKRPVYTAECDIYSLGVIFWHISSGRIPFASRLREPLLLRELMEGVREEIVPGTPREFRDLIVRCWDVKPAKRLKIDVVIAILQTLLAKPSEPLHQISTGFMAVGDTLSAALPIPPELEARTRAYFGERGSSLEAYSPSNPPKTPIYLCPLVGDIGALQYYLSHVRRTHNPINESSEQTGDTALHLACLFLESPMDTIKVLVELGADINLENRQGYTPVMILVSSNTQYCYEALKYFVMRGARIPAHVQKPITPLNSAQIYALHIVNESRGVNRDDALGTGSGTSVSYTSQDRRHSRMRISHSNQNVYQERGRRKVERLSAQGRPLIHIVAAMQEDYRILDCLCEAGLDPAMSFAGETALVAAAAHLRIKNVEWLLNHDLDISTESGIQRAIKVVKMLHLHNSQSYSSGGGHGKSSSSSSYSGRISLSSQPVVDFPDEIRDLGKYSWAGVAYGEADRMSKDMVGPVLNLLEQWTGNKRILHRKEVATKLKLMYGPSMDPFSSQNGGGPRASTVSVASTNSDSSSSSSNSQRYQGQASYRQNQVRGPLVHGSRSMRKNQRHLIDQVLAEKPRLW
ncbi:hypothetical protein BGZ46_000204 [Entomortierella lignicola]|nr:hypothetical protein BGZ46_000204 [Entomortierella lignicola]